MKTALSKQTCRPKNTNPFPGPNATAGDPAFLKELYRRIAFREGEFGIAFGEGPGYLAARWKFPESYFNMRRHNYWKMGHPGHHANEDAGQAGVLINLIYNRDAQCHSHSNFVRNGLPIKNTKSRLRKNSGAQEPWTKFRISHG